MKHNLPRQSLNTEINKILDREMHKQKVSLDPLSKKHLKELDQIVKAIDKWTFPKHLICKKLPHKLGRGIFLHPEAEPIWEGQMIACYSGEVSLVPQNDIGNGDYAFTPLEKMLLNKEEQLHYDKKNVYSPRRYYTMKVDALKRGNFTRFINHSSRPNVIAELMKIRANPFGMTLAPIEVIYFAKKTIYPGQQLLVSYEDGEESYWGVSKIKPFPMTPKTFQLNSSLKVIKNLSKV